MNSSDKSSQFQLYIGLSAVLHFILLLLFTKKPNIDQEPVQFQPSVRVDVVALPDKYTPPVTPTKKKTDTPSPPPPSTPKKDKPSKKSTKKISKDRTQSALKRLQALEQLEQSVMKEAQKKVATQIKKRQYKGNILSPGTALTGLNKVQHNQYLGELQQHVQKHFSLPEWLANQDLKAEVLVRFDPRGFVISKKLQTPSGSSSFDDAVMSSIEKASPFPKPPEKFRKIAEINGMVLAFP